MWQWEHMSFDNVSAEKIPLSMAYVIIINLDESVILFYKYTILISQFSQVDRRTIKTGMFVKKMRALSSIY